MRKKNLRLFTGRSCNALWTFERFVDKELRSNVRDTIRDVTKTECEDLCLSENRFDCRSASYDHLRNECHLSADDRHINPDSFVAKAGTDYLENQCTQEQAKCDYAEQLQVSPEIDQPFVKSFLSIFML